MTSIVIRPMLADDIPIITRWMQETLLWQRYQVQPGEAAVRFETALARGDLLLAADNDEAACGFIWMIQKGAFGHWPYIRLLGVKENQRGRGVGDALIGEVERRIESSDLFLLVSDFNAPAQRFYKRLGFVQIGAIPGFAQPDIDELIMRKKLR
jgi:ribosomal protein S18 acetylase RimI-like enzyme